MISHMQEMQLVGLAFMSSLEWAIIGLIQVSIVALVVLFLIESWDTLGISALIVIQDLL